MKDWINLHGSLDHMNKHKSSVDLETIYKEKISLQKYKKKNTLWEYSHLSVTYCHCVCSWWPAGQEHMIGIRITKIRIQSWPVAPKGGDKGNCSKDAKKWKYN